MGQSYSPFSACTSPALTAMFWQGFEAASKAATPLMQSAYQSQFEMMGLASKRMRAWLEIPSQLASCRTPQDLMLAQSRFWQTAMSDYAEAGRKTASGWQAQLADVSKSISTSMEIARDRLEFPDPTAPSHAPYVPAYGDERRSDEPRVGQDRDRTDRDRDRRHAA